MPRRRKGIRHTKPIGKTPVREAVRISVLLILHREGPLSPTDRELGLGLISKQDKAMMERVLLKAREDGLISGEDPIQLTEAGKTYVETQILKLERIEKGRLG